MTTWVSERATARPGADSPPPGHDAANESLPWLKLVGLVGRHVRAIAITILVTALATLITVLVLPKKYTTTASFTPESTDIDASSLAGLAGQFGVRIGDASAGSSPEFYVAMLRTPTILRRIAERSYVVKVDGTPTTASFITMYDVDEGDPGRTLDEALRILNTKIIDVSLDRQTSIVTVRVTTKWPDLSLQIASELLAQIDTFNMSTRQTEARAERDFRRSRLDTAHAELRAAEDRLEQFLARNHAFSSDPSLTFEHDRLDRDVTTRQGVYTTLLQLYEQARVNAVRNTPSISILEKPVTALRPDHRHVAVKTLAAGILGGFVALCFFLLQDFLRNTRRDHPDEFKELERALPFGGRWLGRAGGER